jgi:hypothetical protein
MAGGGVGRINRDGSGNSLMISAIQHRELKTSAIPLQRRKSGPNQGSGLGHKPKSAFASGDEAAGEAVTERASRDVAYLMKLSSTQVGDRIDPR